MISFGSGADALVFDVFHLCFLIVSGLALTFALKYRSERDEARSDGERDQESALKDVETQHQTALAALKADHDKSFVAVEARLQAETAQRERDHAELESLKGQISDLRGRAEGAERKLSAYEAHTAEREKAFEAERESLQTMSKDVQEKFQALADGALRASQRQFIEIADQQLKKHKEGAEGELKKLMKPIEDSFGQFREKVDNIQKVTNEDRASMRTQFNTLMENMRLTQEATTKLTTALSAPKGGGRWGEETLRNVLEMAGLSQHADFAEQTHAQSENGAIRPDVIIRMPGGRELVIDAKVSIDDFLAASDEADPAKRKNLLESHARKVRAHVTTLGKKSYWAELSEAVDFVAMFIPGENFYAAALEHDRDLFDYAAEKKVIIVTPSTLIALAKAVAYGWRQEEAARNAREVTDLARELYKRIATLGEKVVKLGKGISGSAAAYNELVGTLEGQVLPQARKFDAMGMDHDSKSIPVLTEVDEHVRQPKRGKDLVLPGVGEDDAPPLLAAATKSRRKSA